MHCLV